MVVMVVVVAVELEAVPVLILLEVALSVKVMMEGLVMLLLMITAAAAGGLEWLALSVLVVEPEEMVYLVTLTELLQLELAAAAVVVVEMMLLEEVAAVEREKITMALVEPQQPAEAAEEITPEEVKEAAEAA